MSEKTEDEYPLSPAGSAVTIEDPENRSTTDIDSTELNGSFTRRSSTSVTRPESAPLLPAAHEAKTRKRRRFFYTSVALKAVIMFLLASVIGIGIYLTFIYKPNTAAVVSLAMPSDTSYDLSVDSTKYSSIEFSFSDSSVGDVANIQFILRTIDNSEFVPYNYQFNNSAGGCSVYANGEPNDDCLIVRYWPVKYKQITTGTLRCQSEDSTVVAKETYLYWTWFYFNKFRPGDIPQCPAADDLEDYHKCTDSNPLTAQNILNERSPKDKHDTIVMRFCTLSGADDIVYYINLTEYRPFFQEPYNMYSMGSGTGNEAVTVPLVKNVDNHIRIISTRSGQSGPIELQYQRTERYQETTMERHSDGAFYGSAGVSVASFIMFVLVCIDCVCLKRNVVFKN